MDDLIVVLPSEMKEARLSALNFLNKCVRGGLAHSLDTKRNRWVKPYPEVTGYLLSLFSTAAQNFDFAEKMARRLMALQRESGGWQTFYGRYVYTFDTAQIGKGLIDWYELSKDAQILEACRKAAYFISSMQNSDGSFFPMLSEKHKEKVMLGVDWGDSFSPINNKCNEFLAHMTRSGFGDYSQEIKKSSEWTLSKDQLQYTHPGAYSLEGLLADNRVAEVRERLKKNFLPFVADNGFLPYKSDMTYSYVSGSVQIGILCAKVGLMDYAHRIFSWARLVQLRHSSGGLFQYANKDGSLNCDVHAEINSWGTKYYVELIDLLL